MPPYVSEAGLECLELTVQEHNPHSGATLDKYSLQSNPPTDSAQHHDYPSDSYTSPCSENEQKTSTSTPTTSKTASKLAKRVVSPYFDQRQWCWPTPHTEDSWTDYEKKRAKLPLDLDVMKPQQRNQVYRHHFEAALPIADIASPYLATAFANLKDEIILAYFENTTFIYKIFINYDAVSCLFYTDQLRFQDCGKLVLSSKKKVRLDVCSYWRTLARITLEVRKTKVNVGIIIAKYVSKLTKPWHGHETLEDFIDGVAEKIAGQDPDCTRGKPRFNFADLEDVARLFAVEQTAREWKESQAFNYDGPWEGKHNEQGFKTTKGTPRHGYRVSKKWRSG